MKTAGILTRLINETIGATRGECAYPIAEDFAKIIDKLYASQPIQGGQKLPTEGRTGSDNICNCKSANYGYGFAKCYDCGKIKDFKL